MRDAWRLSVGTLTAVPVRPPEVVDRRNAGRAMLLAPLAAVPLGVGVSVALLLGHWLTLPPLVSALLAVGAAVLGNRAFHLDGLSDVVDGMSASFDRERSLAVMKSGTSGPAGVIAMILVVGLQVAALAALAASPHWWQAALLAGVALCVSRIALATCCARGNVPARPDGLGRLYTQTVPRPYVVGLWLLGAAVLGALGAAAGLPWWRGPVAALLGLGVVVIVIARARVRFGGVTGDVFGAGVELALAAVLVGLSAGA
ncbi:adenosylcobinamide-GDP ribazoletransferase [Nocardioides sp.]|uniref:adenosylcobinamide-GDP ribazoletransferase n=1 Tax=Nocardioides sp. TaxID=35761 RepID=UPI0026370F4A|nr:adenosylcobinamide-GDP ribazoletransferase [Nocardioides sp.]